MSPHLMKVKVKNQIVLINIALNSRPPPRRTEPLSIKRASKMIYRLYWRATKERTRYLAATLHLFCLSLRELLGEKGTERYYMRRATHPLSNPPLYSLRLVYFVETCCTRLWKVLNDLLLASSAWRSSYRIHCKG